MGKTLSIETGIGCNNRCRFCYQRAWREGGRLPDLTTEQILARLAWGRQQGYDEVGFSGGEPTIRRDFLELVRAATAAGYRRISLTTNGRRFANQRFAADALAAGIDSIGWSLHGADPATHDSLVGRQGAFAQLLRGLANIRMEVARTRRRVDQNLFVLVNRSNHEQLPAIGGIGREHGIGLLICQPVTYSKGNLAAAFGLRLELPELLLAVRAAAAAGRRDGWHIKLFNLPVCFFADLPEGFEHQRYPVEIFRLQEEGRAGGAVAPGIGYFRLDRCRRCLLARHCPGLHQSLVPQARLGAMVAQTLQRPAGPDLWLAGTELLGAETLAQTLAQLRPRGRLRLYHGGDGADCELLGPILARAGVDELALQLVPPADDEQELTALGGGNLARLMTLADSLAGSRTVPRMVLALPMLSGLQAGIPPSLARAARPGLGLELQLPADYKRPDLFDLAIFLRLARQWRELGGGDSAVVGGSPAVAGTMVYRGGMAMAGLSRLAVSSYAPHALSGPAGSWIALSLPAFVRGSPLLSGERLTLPELADLPGGPMTAELLARMRPG